MQQEMQHQTPPPFGYEGEQPSHLSPYQRNNDKLLVPMRGQAPTAGQRLALAIVSLGMLIFLIFGLTLFAALSNAPNWAVVPILFIFVLFAAVAVAINALFNRHA